MGSDSERKNRDVRRDRDRNHHERSRERSRDRNRDRDRSKHGEERRRRFSPEPRVKEERVKRERTSDDENDRRRNRHENNDRQRRRHPKEEVDDGKFEFGMRKVKEDPDVPPAEKKKPDFGLSGKLTEDTNTFKGVVIKYSEPPEARKPKRKWRLYVFKGSESLPHIEIHRQSAYLLGRDRKVADIPVDHPSCSKQHAALQFRVVKFTREDGTTGRRVRPYIMDLESANGTFVNNNKIESKRYVELLEKDMIKFGFSSREYILLHADSADSGDEGEEPPPEEEEKK